MRRDVRLWVRRVMVLALAAPVTCLAILLSVSPESTYLTDARAQTDHRSDVRFLQFELQRRDRIQGRLSSFDWIIARFSEWARYMREVDLGLPEKLEAGAALTIAHKMFSALPRFIAVWPSESYYYFQVATDSGKYAGNFRFTDLPDGIATFAIYRLDGEAEALSTSLTAENGFSVSRLTESFYALKLNDQTVYAYVDDAVHFSGQPPLHRATEEVVSWLRDESGIRFFLFFERDLRSFFYVLDETVPSSEEFERVDDLLVGKRTKFAFFSEESLRRKVLLGISAAEAASNSYFDGPFDQVPGRLELRSMLYEAYPYLRLAGTDPWGYFCMTPGIRTAITPYLTYETREQLLSHYFDCRAAAPDHAALLNCLTFDSKQANHLKSKAFNPDGSFVTKREARECPPRAIQLARHHNARDVVLVPPRNGVDIGR